MHSSTLHYSNPDHTVPSTLPLSSSLTPSPLNKLFFSVIVMPSPSLGQLPLNPPSVPPVATTRWHGTSGANGFLRSALPTARGDVPRCADSRPYVVTRPRGIWHRAVHTRFSKGVRWLCAMRRSCGCMSAGTWTDVDVGLGLGCFVDFRILEIEDFIAVVVFDGLLRFWMVGAMGGGLIACVLSARWR